MTIDQQFSAPNVLQHDHFDSSGILVNDLQQGDAFAASRLHQLFSQRLLTLVRQRMNPAFNRRFDPEDVVQSAFRSFFRVVSNESWSPEGHAERVWSLLCAITLNKLNAKIRFHTAGKRSVDQEEFDVEILFDSGAHEAETIFADELEFVMQENTEFHQQILELLLAGHSEVEVAETKQCSLRTVYRVLERVVDQLQFRLSQ